MFTPLQRVSLAALMALIPVKESFCTTCSVPEIRVKPNTNGSFYAIEKSDVKFSCNIRRKGREVYQVQWEKDNKTLRAADHKQVTIERRWLKIKNVKRDDAGLYSCIVLNKCGGWNVVHIRLYIRELLPTPTVNRNLTSAAPRFIVSKRKLQKTLLALPVGNSVKLDCSAKGYPHPTIAWYKNRKPFNERRGRLPYLDGKYVLRLKDVVPSDTGTYTCNVSNHLGWINHSYYVDVHERTRAKPVVIPMINATAFVGESATLQCRAYSDAMPHFQWLRWFPMHFNSSDNSTEGSKFQYEVIKQNQQAPINWLSTSNSRHAFHEVTLTLDNVTKKSEGKYTCLVRNSLGYALRNAYIIVHEKIDEIRSEDGSTSTTSAANSVLPTPTVNRNLTSAAPRFTVSKRKLQKTLLALPVGNSVKLDCSAKGYPHPTIAWYKNGKPFDERRGRLLYLDGKYVLRLKDVVPSDTGRYTCNVSNHLGWINHSYYVDVRERTRAKPVVIPMINATAFVGESATLQCRAYSDAMPHFQWLRWFPMHFNSSGNSTEGSKFQYEVIKQNQQAPINWLSTSNSRHAFHEVTLTLDNVTKKSEGKYTCLVRNSLGYALRNAYIIVHEKIDEIRSEDGSTSTTSAANSDSNEAGGQKRERPAEKKSWIDRIGRLSIGILATVIVAVITVPVWFCWKLKKSRASSPPAIASLRPRYDARNEYVVVPDLK